MTRLTPLALVVLLLSAHGCVGVVPPTDTGDPVVQTTTSTTTSTVPGTTNTPSTSTTTTVPADTIAYNPDIAPILAGDCLVCHGGSRVDGNYRVNTYAQTMTAVVPGNASSRLIRVTQSNGSMYRYFSGSTTTRQTKSNQIRNWIVTYNARENR